jgi:hypothetical protein
MLIDYRLENESADIDVASDVVFSLWAFRMGWETFGECAEITFFWKVLFNQLKDIEVSM